MKAIVDNLNGWSLSITSMKNVFVDKKNFKSKVDLDKYLEIYSHLYKEIKF